ncbi:helix-turn-helix transcriptional regulator [Roseibacillus ishigakijimensis]
MARPAKTQQPDYGAHLASLRHAASLSQQQVADLVGVRQATVAAWERSATPPRGEFLVPLSETLAVSLEVLLQADKRKSARHRGPASKLENLVAQATQLPRRRQQRIASLLEALIAEEAKAS